MKERLAADLVQATKARDPVRRETLRLILSAVHNAEVEQRGAPLNDAGIVGVLQKQAKMRRESIEAFGKAGRAELVDREKRELTIVESYLPEQLDRSEIEERARAAIAETGATSPRDQGRVMQRLMAELRGRADGKVVADVVFGLLSGRSPG